MPRIAKSHLCSDCYPEFPYNPATFKNKYFNRVRQDPPGSSDVGGGGGENGGGGNGDGNVLGFPEIR